ncbi:hypothetical protein [Legionella oakridgensis]|uniref:YqaE/Pmp3 family membrane protein n=2 Tax=Legionella oakridgensis TaxID=29423 RepID=W0BAX6_9GAMM|nr:hypothetical protein [Legionella oakridgensis]AHE65752.1 hypothetical protein Loa_00161 [Legionella oakridgensis ATCC 33761 = DSM 21215]ETO94401.1 hypothetical protein LOR_55c11860 [Legionella oakridgensis RV-2-2007]KTD38175.1 hypothetical protein Loak_1851 [Legionella oakridgensis]STY15695.1 Uncharacterised protein [Legionella longbeachae]
MKRFILSCIALFFPALVLLIYDNPGGALVALILQATIIGWIPAAMWAFKTIHEEKKSSSQRKNS